MNEQLHIARHLVACALIALAGSAHARNLGVSAPHSFQPAMQGGGTRSQSVVGTWHGTKIENDPINGGYMTLNFSFTFAADGNYQESAYIGAALAMSANGNYQQNGEQLSFSPQRCNFPTGLGDKVKLFPIPNETAITATTYFSPWQSGSQISLKDGASGESWGLKPGAQESLNFYKSSPAILAKGDSSRPESDEMSNLWTLLGNRDTSQRLVPASFVQTQRPRKRSLLPASAPPELIFDRLSNVLEKQFFKEATSNQRRVILEHFADRYHRQLSGNPFLYDDFDESIISVTQMFKALAYPELLDVYNAAKPQEQCAMAKHGYARWIEFEMGIKLSLEQEDRAAQAKAGSVCF